MIQPKMVSIKGTDANEGSPKMMIRPMMVLMRGTEENSPGFFVADPVRFGSVAAAVALCVLTSFASSETCPGTCLLSLCGELHECDEVYASSATCTSLCASSDTCPSPPRDELHEEGQSTFAGST